MRTRRPQALVGLTQLALSGAACGGIQACLWAGFLKSAITGPDDGNEFSGLRSLPYQGLWLLGYLVVTTTLIPLALRHAAVRWYGAVAVLVIVVETIAGAEIASKIPGHSDWKSLTLIAVLAVEFLLAGIFISTKAGNTE
ncbi:MAG: hypothetical protein JWO63_2719 [Frankiales bacterium]|nr:hypothetical protein [Frankiales bacterium]